MVTVCLCDYNKRHPREMGAKEIEIYLSFLAIEKRCTKSTQRTALNALVFLFKQFLQFQLTEKFYFKRAVKKSRIPVVLSPLDSLNTI